MSSNGADVLDQDLPETDKDSPDRGLILRRTDVPVTLSELAASYAFLAKPALRLQEVQ
jgi:hypothetical protein